ncbi:serine/threonine protein kinase [Escherichia coli]|nr:serine/threonine protein kinase [Escherichia coli]MDC7934523.1 serine/threonine protein kinase [Escherichia coli]
MITDVWKYRGKSSHLHPSIDRSLASWHYPNSPNNGKPALSPHHGWLKTGSLRQNAPLRIWFYPQ